MNGGDGKLKPASGAKLAFLNLHHQPPTLQVWFSLDAEEPRPLLMELKMYKQAACGAILLIASTQLANAANCVSYNGQTDVFTNACTTDVIISYRTVGGGCFASNAEKFTLAKGRTSSQPLLSEYCGSSGNFSVEWNSCSVVEYESGACKLDF